MINQQADEVIGISLGLLGGVEQFRYGPLACKMLFLKASEVNKDNNWRKRYFFHLLREEVL